VRSSLVQREWGQAGSLASATFRAILSRRLGDNTPALKGIKRWTERLSRVWRTRISRFEKKIGYKWTVTAEVKGEVDWGILTRPEGECVCFVLLLLPQSALISSSKSWIELFQLSALRSAFLGGRR
jgi:hypothetical protein